MRRAGILLHPTSLPGPYGIGDIGPAARKFLRWLAAAQQSVWQVLPLNPTEPLGSPYTSPSGFAFNPLLISIDDLIAEGWLDHADKPYAPGDPYQVDYPAVIAAKTPVLSRAADRIRAHIDLASWADARPWVRDWGLFAALSEVHGPHWTTWPAALRDRTPKVIAQATSSHAEAVERHIALQWAFVTQWARLRIEAEALGISLWGDLPIFVGGESCDTWAHPELFRLDRAGKPTVISGVPPDAFSEAGQLWGHPLYDFDACAAQNWSWWLDRLDVLLEQVDAVRLDHFRGLVALWESPADAKDARGGKWTPGPGAPLLQAIADRFGRVPLIAEDLGIITKDVHTLRDAFDLPGMAILQFAFSHRVAAGNPYLPHNHRKNMVVYPGTHDNDTVHGWYWTADEATRDHVRRYLTCNGADISWDLIRAANRSVADHAVVAMQDVLSLDGSARMNAPGRAMGNWGWRMGVEAMNLVLARRLADEATVTGRRPLPESDTVVSSPSGD